MKVRNRVDVWIRFCHIANGNFIRPSEKGHINKYWLKIYADIASASKRNIFSIFHICRKSFSSKFKLHCLTGFLLQTVCFRYKWCRMFCLLKSILIKIPSRYFFFRLMDHIIILLQNRFQYASVQMQHLNEGHILGIWC